MVIAAAMERAASTTPTRYIAALRAIRHPGITADIEFDERGELKQGLLSIYRVQDGKWVPQ
jgi:branched-chain amino acid transport system substrate-binding protein